MTWRNNLQQASFRDVEFHVLSHEYAIGRRNVVHQYPFSDKPYIEDMGLDTDEFSIEGYILANNDNDYDYFTQRNLLIAALKKIGPGTLIHPYLGKKYVNLLGKARIREIFNEGGIARFTMTFVTSGEPVSPKESIDPTGLVDSSAGKLANTTLDSFNDQYTLDKAPGFAVQGAIADFNGFSTLIKTKVNAMRSATGSALESIKSTIDDARALSISIIKTPCEVANLVLDVTESVLEAVNIVGNGYLGQVLGQCSGQVIKRTLSITGDFIKEDIGKSMVYGFLGIVGYSDITGFGASLDDSITTSGALSQISVTTNSRARQAANRLSFVNMVKTINLIGAARTAIRTEYKNTIEIDNIKDVVIKSIDYMLEKLGDESASDPYKDFGIYVDNRNIYSGIEELRSVFSRAIKEKYLSLPYEVEKEIPPDGSTSLQVAYEQYNDIERNQEVFEKNQPTLSHPGFIIENITVSSK